MLSAAPDTQRTDFASENEPDMLSQAFEDDAVRREQEMNDLWGSKWPKFKTEDPTRTSSFKGLDRTKIPANADYLVNDPIGLEIFLRLAKHRIPSHPLSAVGLHPGPAFMSYGSAVAKYGPPEAPGEDWPSEDQIDENVDRDGIAQGTSSASDKKNTPIFQSCLGHCSKRAASSSTHRCLLLSMPSLSERSPANQLCPKMPSV